MLNDDEVRGQATWIRFESRRKTPSRPQGIRANDAGPYIMGLAATGIVIVS